MCSGSNSSYSSNTDAGRVGEIAFQTQKYDRLLHGWTDQGLFELWHDPLDVVEQMIGN